MVEATNFKECRIMKKIFCYFAAFAALVSCTKENAIDEIGNVKEFSFLAYAPGTDVPESKSTLAEDGVSVLWEDGDAVKVFVRGKSSSYDNISTIFTTTLSNASGQAYFKGNLSNAYNNDHHQYAHAAYPSSVNIAYQNSSISASYDLEDEQIAGKNGSFGAYNLSSSSLYFDYSLENENSNALFLNACAVIKVKAPADLNYIKVTSNNSTSLAGTAELTFNQVKFNDMNLNAQNSAFDNYTYRLVPTSFTEGSASVTLTNGDQPLKKDVVYNIVVWPGEHSQGLTIEMEDTEGKKFKKSNSNTINFEASKYKTFTFSNVEFVEPVQPAVGLYINNDGSFSNEFISGTSIAKIFWIGDPTSSDSQLKVDYPHCTHGLAYEVNSEGIIKLEKPEWGSSTYGTWGSGTSNIINGNNYTNYTSKDNIHGYANSYAIKTNFNMKYMTAVDLSVSVVGGITSSWFIPSVGEIKLMIDGIGSSDVWTSSVSFSAGIITAQYYQNGDVKTATGTYDNHYVIRILAF